MQAMLISITAIFSGSLVIAAVLASKIIAVGPFLVPAGVLAYSITFLCTDMVGEVYGKQTAQRVVISGFVTLLLVMGLIQLAIVWPSAPWWKRGEAFDGVLGQSFRIILASIIAYLVSQFFDIWIFSKIKDATQGRFLWIRNNSSTILSQLIDSILFVSIAFWGKLPIQEIIIGQWIVKIGIALLDTPFVYIGVYLMKGNENVVTAQT
jgi:queuosine precursor transporter